MLLNEEIDFIFEENSLFMSLSLQILLKGFFKNYPFTSHLIDKNSLPNAFLC